MKPAVLPLLILSASFAMQAVSLSSIYAQSRGFQLNRYEPTTPAESTFFVDHPWYSKAQKLAMGATLDYSHNPYLFTLSARGGDIDKLSIIEHQTVLHLDVAGSLFDRLTMSFSMPITLVERGQIENGIVPTKGAGGDPRLGVFVRIFGQPDRGRISLSFGGQVWIPARAFTTRLPEQVGDSQVRGIPKLVLAGLFARVRWSFSFGIMIREDSELGNSAILDGSGTGSSVQFAGLLQYADPRQRFATGVEMLFDSVITSGHAFLSNWSSLELLFGAHYNVLSQLQLGLGAGVGFLSAPGTPDARLLLRCAYSLKDIRR